MGEDYTIDGLLCECGRLARERDALRAEVERLTEEIHERKHAWHECNRQRMIAESEVVRLRGAIEKHRNDVWGDGPVDHDRDAVLYAALSTPSPTGEKVKP